MKIEDFIRLIYSDFGTGCMFFQKHFYKYYFYYGVEINCLSQMLRKCNHWVKINYSVVARHNHEDQAYSQSQKNVTMTKKTIYVCVHSQHPGITRSMVRATSSLKY